MKVIVLGIGKTNIAYLKEGTEQYIKRIKKYIPFEFDLLPDIKNAKSLDTITLKKREGEAILQFLSKRNTYVPILLDEQSQEYSSVQFAKFIENKMISGTQGLVFIIGGAYGFSKDVYKYAKQKISLSKMTFSHQMVRLLFFEQLYRAFTIINGEPYHHI